MSRGERVSASGILTSSMRDNYGEHGVEEYYKKVGATYRNPHFPGIRLCMFSWLNKWWSNERQHITAMPEGAITLFDMACGSGEATACFVEWCTLGKKAYRQSISQDAQTFASEPIRQTIPHKRPTARLVVEPVALDSTFPRPLIFAADPFTSIAYQDRTTFPCAQLSFADIAEGLYPTSCIDISTGQVRTAVEGTGADDSLASSDSEASLEWNNEPAIEMVICSFALHLIDSPSELFALLSELSRKARWFVVLAPHKRPEIKESWGWMKWNVESWSSCSMSEHKGEFLCERVHCRVYRSVNF